MKGKILNTVVFVLIVVAIAAFVQIESLKSDIRLLQHDKDNNIHMLEQKISNIHRDVDEQMKKQASLFSDVAHSLGGLDSDSRTVKVNVSIVPKTIVEGMQIAVSLGENTVQMERRENGSFAAALSVGMFEEYDSFPLVTIRSGKETKTEYLEGVAVSYLWQNFLPTVETAELWNDDITFREESDSEKNSLAVNGYMDMYFRKADLSPEIVFEKIYAVAETENGEAARTLIAETEKVKYGAKGAVEGLKENVAERTELGDGEVSLSVSFREIYEVGESKYLRVYIVAEDSLGYVHKTCAFEWNRPDADGNAYERTTPEWAGAHNRGEQIFDKDGKLLYGKEY